jgi:hypothetical protein
MAHLHYSVLLVRIVTQREPGKEAQPRRERGANSNRKCRVLVGLSRESEFDYTTLMPTLERPKPHLPNFRFSPVSEAEGRISAIFGVDSGQKGRSFTQQIGKRKLHACQLPHADLETASSDSQLRLKR